MTVVKETLHRAYASAPGQVSDSFGLPFTKAPRELSLEKEDRVEEELMLTNSFYPVVELSWSSERQPLLSECASRRHMHGLSGDEGHTVATPACEAEDESFRAVQNGPYKTTRIFTESTKIVIDKKLPKIYHCSPASTTESLLDPLSTWPMSLLCSNLLLGRSYLRQRSQATRCRSFKIQTGIASVSISTSTISGPMNVKSYQRPWATKPAGSPSTCLLEWS